MSWVECLSICLLCLALESLLARYYLRRRIALAEHKVRGAEQIAMQTWREMCSFRSALIKANLWQPRRPRRPTSQGPYDVSKPRFDRGE